MTIVYCGRRKTAVDWASADHLRSPGHLDIQDSVRIGGARLRPSCGPPAADKLVDSLRDFAEDAERWFWDRGLLVLLGKDVKTVPDMLNLPCFTCDYEQNSTKLGGTVNV